MKLMNEMQINEMNEGNEKRARIDWMGREMVVDQDRQAGREHELNLPIERRYEVHAGRAGAAGLLEVHAERGDSDVEVEVGDVLRLEVGRAEAAEAVEELAYLARQRSIVSHGTAARGVRRTVSDAA